MSGDPWIGMAKQKSSTDSRSFGHGIAQCPICSATDHAHVEDVFDDRYGCPDAFQLVRCKRCGHLMTSPSLLDEELPALYSTYYPRKNVDAGELLRAASAVDGLAARLRRWWEGTNCQGQYSVRPGQTILDVGCGNGLSLLEAGRFGGQAFGIEADPNVRPIAEELGLRIHIGSLYDHPFPGMRFDLIVLNQVIEHIPHPGKMLAALRDRLEPGGRIVLAFPNRASFWCRLSGGKWINWHIPYHLHHFDSQTFESLAGRHGYRVVHRRTITPNLWTTLQLRALRGFPKLGTPNALWTTVTSPPHGDAPVRSFTLFLPARAARALLRRIVGVGRGLMNRVIDVAGYGDSIMVELETAVGLEGDSFDVPDIRNDSCKATR